MGRFYFNKSNILKSQFDGRNQSSSPGLTESNPEVSRRVPKKSFRKEKVAKVADQELSDLTIGAVALKVAKTSVPGVKFILLSEVSVIATSREKLPQSSRARL